MKIDLTLRITENHSAYSLFKKSKDEILRLGHFATHLDVHLKTRVPLEYMQRRGILIDVSHSTNNDVEFYEVDLSGVLENDFVIFKTDMMKHHEYGSKAYFTQHKQLSNDIIDALIEKKVSFIGIDAAGVRRGEEHIHADKRCEAKNIYIIENLDHLDELRAATHEVFSVTTLWIDVPGQTGLPCRVIATTNPWHKPE